ncbi:BTAD domain-containing putative transcriptional regulator [Kibdelosporangium aridum]|uniref:AfsR/SARP family transcriptional regulator n=1 Tax=Kibdelosporangium aridum TaxID=2030 RepID=UPI00068D81C0|nr:BTAD domain-containing putative transcriptional regulator [Kibdelosporangium aridum]
MLSYRLLGPLRVLRDGTEIRLGTPQAKAVLAVLLMASGEVVTRDRIADELWGDEPPASAKVQIQGLVSQLRRALDGDKIVTRGAGYLLNVTHRDDWLFSRLAAAGRELIDDGQVESGARKLRSALELWRGSYLIDIDIPLARSNAVQWAELRLAATEDRIAADLELGRSAQVIPELTDLVADHPFRERPRGQLMTAMARAGRIAEALKVYDGWRQVLNDELGVQPSPALRALHGGILRADPGLRPTSYARCRPGSPRQLPPDIPDFVGRRDVLDRGLQDNLLIVGPGGIGKSALALRVAHQAKGRYPDGQLFASLRGTGNEPVPPLAVLGRFLRALGVPADMVPTEVDSCAGLFRDMLSGRRMLVVLDDAADEYQIRSLLPDDPGCAVVVTSRRRIPGLTTVELNGLPACDAVTLLSNVVGRQRLHIDEMTELHAACGGSPLAMRIVGGRLADRPQWTVRHVVRSLTADRDRVPSDDRAVRSSFLLSYRELEPRAKQLFDRLGALSAADFAGWVATALLDDEGNRECGDLGEGGDAQALLDELVARHMVQRVDPTRYRIHDLLRSLARDNALSASRDAVERALGGWLWLAETAADRLPPNVLRPEPGSALRWAVTDELIGDPLAWFDSEQPALEAAITLAAELGFGELAWELAAACANYFEHRGLFDDWLRCHLRALPAARKHGCDRGAAALLRGIGQVHIFWDNYSQATEVIAESFDISARIGDRPGMARGLSGKGILARELGQFDDAMPYFQRALAIFAELGDLNSAIQVRNNIAVVRVHQGLLDDAQACLDESLRECVVLGDDHRTATVLRVYGRLCLDRDDAPSAIGYLGRALEIVDAMHDESCTAHARLLLGRAHAMLGDYEAARNALRTASVQFVETGNGRSEAACARLLGELTPAHDRL